ncbi:hypothetical protein BUN20_17230 [Bacteroides fragilis]|nr:hypothetical protein BUN20_17230 [Bacteroides fragilis]
MCFGRTCPVFGGGEKLWQNVLLTLVFYLFFSSHFTLSRSLSFFLFVSFISHPLFCPLLREMHFYLPSSTFFHLFI